MKKIHYITVFQNTGFDFNEPATDDENFVYDLRFTTLKCPFCNKINRNLTIFDFSSYSDEKVNDFLFMNQIDECIDNHYSIFQCHSCKKFFKLNFQDSTNEQLVIQYLLSKL